MPLSANREAMAQRVEREFLRGSLRLHILQHASRGEVFGAGLMEELRGQGYLLSPGTLYPILHALERTGYLESETHRVNGRRRRGYTATINGKAVLRASRLQIETLLLEMLEGEGLAAPGGAKRASQATAPRRSTGAARVRSARTTQPTAKEHKA